MKSEAINPQTISGLVWKSMGPGWILKDWKATRTTAAVAEVGKPSANIGTKTPAAFALLAASGPATPSIAPLPNSSLFLDKASVNIYSKFTILDLYSKVKLF